MPAYAAVILILMVAAAASITLAIGYYRTACFWRRHYFVARREAIRYRRGAVAWIADRKVA